MDKKGIGSDRSFGRNRDMERPISSNAYGPIDTDLARDNLENDIPFADLQDI